MKIEHPLPAESLPYVRRALEQLATERQNYLIALGTAKEAEQRAESVRQALSQHLQNVVESARLPASIRPYALNDAGTGLEGEAPDQVAPAPTPIAPAKPNGKGKSETGAHA
jgi:hypothetical protein